ncbi:MAG: serine/threonine-protein kinase [Candidatus Spyradosoma sp.]
MSDEKESFSPGERIGDYEVISVLGFGATGTVYLTQHAVLKKLFAVKVLSGDLAFMPEFVRVFQHEAQIVAALSHENIVPVHNFGECDGLYYYVMDFVNGGTLEDVRRRNGGRLRPDAAISLISAVARGLAYAHAYGVVHRDLKPENILLTRTGTPQITDFGMAYVDRKYIAGQRRMNERRRSRAGAKFRAVVGRAPAETQSYTPSQTQIAIEENAEDNPEIEGGTEGYIAPEVSRGSAATPRADVYALGALLHFLLVGETPQEPGRLSPEIFKLRNRALADVLSRSLSVVPSRRYPTAKEFLEALERVSSAPARRKRRFLYALGIALILAIFAFAFSSGERSQKRKTETRVAVAAQKMFDAENAAKAQREIPPPPPPESFESEPPPRNDVPAKRPGVSEDGDADRARASTNVPAATSERVAAESKEAAVVPAVPPQTPSESAEREYWERVCAERTGRRGVVVSFPADLSGSGAKISAANAIEFSSPIRPGAYNVYLRTDVSEPQSAAPLRLSVGADQISRVMKFDEATDGSEPRFFAMIEVSVPTDRIRIEIPKSQRNANLPEIGLVEMEIRPTFSNADFSRMFGEFLSALVEK